MEQDQLREKPATKKSKRDYEWFSFRNYKNAFILAIGLLLLVISGVLYIALGVTVIETYINESKYSRTKCTVRDVNIHRANSKDDWFQCPWRCTVNHTPDGLKTTCEMSEYPCLQIIVDVMTRDGLKSAIIHESPDKMTKSQDCSTYVCDRDSVINERDVNRFRRKYGSVGQQYSCYYNVDALNSDDYDDDGQEHALLRLTYNKASYINSWFWPSFCGFVGLIVTFFALYRIKFRIGVPADRNRRQSDDI